MRIHEEYLIHLRFSDDIVLLSESGNNLKNSSAYVHLDRESPVRRLEDR